MAAAFAGAGARVVIVDQTDERAEAAAGPIRATGAQVLALAPTSPAKPSASGSSRRPWRSRTARHHHERRRGRRREGPLRCEVYPRDAWDWIYEINVRSTLCATQAAVKAMIAGGRGGASSTSRRSARRSGSRRYSAYVAAKGAVSSLTRQWRPSGPSTGSPSTRSPDLRGHPAGGDAPRRSGVQGRIVSRIPLGRVGGRATSPVPRSSSARTPPRSSPARFSGSTAA